MARRLLAEEGLFCGGSSGLAMHAAVEYIKKHKIGKDKRCVVLLPDNIRNYITKHLNTDWMYERGYITEQECTESNIPKLVENKDWGQDIKVKDLPLPEANYLTVSTTCAEAVDMMRCSNFDQFPVKDASGAIMGVLSSKDLLGRLYKNQLQMSDTIERAVVRQLRRISGDITLNEVARVMTRNTFALVDDKYMVTIFDVLDAIQRAKNVAPNMPATAKTPKAKEGGSSSLLMMAGMFLAGAAVSFAALKSRQ